MERQVLTKAPILHASVEAVFSPSKSVTLSALKSYAESLASEFPAAAQTATQTVEFGVATDQTTFQQFLTQQRGFSVVNAAKTKSVVAEIDRLVVSYESGFYPPWPSLKEEFFRHITGYIAATSHQSCISLSTRVLNRLELPIQPGGNMSEYLTSYVVAPQTNELPDAVSAFKVDIVVPISESASARIVQQTGKSSVEQGTGEHSLEFVLDITVSENGLNSLADEERVADVLDMLRAKRNAIFFNTFTKRALARYV